MVWEGFNTQALGFLIHIENQRHLKGIGSKCSVWRRCWGKAGRKLKGQETRGWWGGKPSLASHRVHETVTKGLKDVDGVKAGAFLSIAFQKAVQAACASFAADKG